MSSIYCPNTILHDHPKFICYKICTQACSNNLHIVCQIYYHKVRVPSWAVAYLMWCLIRWRSNHILPKFPTSIQDFSEISTHCLYRSPPVLWITLKRWLWRTTWINIATCSSTLVCILSRSKFLSLSKLHSLKKGLFSCAACLYTQHHWSCKSYLSSFVVPHPSRSEGHNRFESLNNDDALESY
jgi:hypothetical protein